MKCAQEDALETSGGVLLLPSMAMPYERLRLQASAVSTRQHSAVMQNGTDDVYNCEVQPVKTTIQTVEVALTVASSMSAYISQVSSKMPARS